MSFFPREGRYCEECKMNCTDDFRKIAELKKGLVIYIHKDYMETRKPAVKNSNSYDTVLLYNSSDKDLKRPHYINEICQYKTRCIKCKTLVKRVHSLLDEIKDIRKNEVVAVCDYCKKNARNKCKRCEYVVNKFMSKNLKQMDERQQRLKAWIYKVKYLLQSILDESASHHKLYEDLASVEELQNLLQELKSPLTVRQPEIGTFPRFDELTSLENFNENKDVLEKVLSKLKSDSCLKRDELTATETIPPTTCVCKYFMGRKFEEKSSAIIPEVKSTKTSEDKQVVTVAKEKVVDKIQTSEEKQVAVKEPSNKTKQKKPAEEKENIDPHAKKLKQKKENIDLETKKSKQGKEKKTPVKLSPSQELLLKLMKTEKQRKIKPEKTVKEKIKHIPIMPDLPVVKLPRLIEMPDSTISESVVECPDTIVQPKLMILGEKVIPFDKRYYEEELDPAAPLLFNVKRDLSSYSLPQIVNAKPDSKPANTSATPGDKSKKARDSMEQGFKGILKFELSNREYIERGWTQLPTTKVMRRMNIYKMMPVNPEKNWFERNKHKKIVYYDTGEIFAQIDTNGCGTWYYKNGKRALEYYRAAEPHVGHRYIVYSSGVHEKTGKLIHTSILGVFDCIGNGVVYDLCGNERLKYNQSEGIVIDKKVGPPGKWKWHTLNDPPVLQKVIVDTYVKHHSECIDNILSGHKDEKVVSTKDESKIPMLLIEAENLLKEKAHKLLQPYKPFEIRMKALKLNQQFSLKIFDQSNILLIFREDKITVKLNIGMLLKHDEIVDTEATDVGLVSTPYDRQLPRSDSVNNLQKKLGDIRKSCKTLTSKN